MNLQELNKIRTQIIEKAEKPFEKGRGKTAMIGEVRVHSGKTWIKHADGWVYISAGKHKIDTKDEKDNRITNDAEEHHVNHYHEHINKDTDSAIELHKKGELPKEEVDKHFEEKEKSLDEQHKEESPMPKIGDKVSITNEAATLISLSSLKGQKLTIVGEVKTGLISQPYFFKVKDENGKEHELNPSYIEKVKEKPKVEDKPKEKVGSLDKLNEIKESVSKPSSDEQNISKIKDLVKERDRKLKRVEELRAKGYGRMKDNFSKSLWKKAHNEVDSVNKDIEKINVKQSEAKKIIKDAGYSSASSHSTAIRGYSTYSAGYEIDNKYSPSLISFHKTSKDEIEKISKKLTEDGIKNTFSSNNIELGRHYYTRNADELAEK